MKKKLFLSAWFSIFFGTCCSMSSTLIDKETDEEFRLRKARIDPLSNPSVFAKGQLERGGSQSKPSIFQESFEAPLPRHSERGKRSVFQETVGVSDDEKVTKQPSVFQEFPNISEDLKKEDDSRSFSHRKLPSGINKITPIRPLPPTSDIASGSSLCPPNPAVFGTGIQYPYGGYQNRRTSGSVLLTKPSVGKRSLSPSSDIEAQHLSIESEGTSTVTTVRQLSSSDYQQSFPQNIYDSPKYQKTIQTGLKEPHLPKEVNYENKGRASLANRSSYLSTFEQKRKKSSLSADSGSVLSEHSKDSESLSKSRPLSSLSEKVPEKAVPSKLKEEKLPDLVEDHSVVDKKVEIPASAEQQPKDSVPSTETKQSASASTSAPILQEAPTTSSSTLLAPTEEQGVILPNEAFDFIHSQNIEGSIYNRGVSALVQILNSEVKRNVLAHGTISPEQMDQILTDYSSIVIDTIMAIYRHRYDLFAEILYKSIPIPSFSSKSPRYLAFEHTATYGFNEIIHAIILFGRIMGVSLPQWKEIALNSLLDNAHAQEFANYFANYIVNMLVASMSLSMKFNTDVPYDVGEWVNKIGYGLEKKTFIVYEREALKILNYSFNVDERYFIN